MKNRPWEVHKFGGTSLGSSKAFLAVKNILENQDKNSRHAIVVSAVAGVTDTLFELIKNKSKALADKLIQKHLQISHELKLDLDNYFGNEAANLRRLLKNTKIHEEEISGLGETWSATILGALLGQTVLNARQVLFVEPGPLGQSVLWAPTRKAFSNFLKKLDTENLVITGFIASLKNKKPTTLKRNGSDYSAGIFSNLLDAKSLTIWKEVDGVMSADPRKVPESFVLRHLSYQEAMELAFFGAKVLHPLSILPALEKKIPIRVRNTFDPKDPGSIISANSDLVDGTQVRGFSVIDKMALINIEGTGMAGVPGTAERVFATLKGADISVVLISQASSEQSICLAISNSEASKAENLLKKEFKSELNAGLLQSIYSKSNQSILAAVGDQMVHTPGVAAKLFSSLAKAGVNIRAIAQGSSERNISVVVNESDSTKALRAVHSGFYLSPQTFSLGLVGPGLIGATFLEQLKNNLELLKSKAGIDIRVRGICDSKKMLLSDKGVDLNTWKRDLESEGVTTDESGFAKFIKAHHLPHCAIVDCTGSQKVADLYETWLENNIHIITPNKKANASNQAYYDRLRVLSKRMNSHFLYETNVGAALPVISTLRDLIQTGDEIIKIEGIFSGTLSYLFNTWDGTTPFSKLVSAAKELGYTEPDPRDDLSGMDVGRKALILAREMGLRLELSDVHIDSLVPEGLLRVPDFLKQYSNHDDAIKARFDKANRENKILRFSAVVPRNGQLKVSLNEYPSTHVFSRVSGTDNIFLFQTKRYFHQPLIVQGPGAGPEVTAGGVFADLLRLASYLGAPL